MKGGLPLEQFMSLSEAKRATTVAKINKLVAELNVYASLYWSLPSVSTIAPFI
jgi:hypothetical protein